MANNKSIQILRGARNKIAGNNDSLLDGQLLYNKTDNYLTVGNGDNAKISDQPVACREVHGYFSDNSGISANNPSAYNYEIKAKPAENNKPETLLITSTGNIELAPTGTLTGKTPTVVDNSVNVATTAWVRNATGDTNLSAASAKQLKDAVKIKIAVGNMTGQADFDGSKDTTITASGQLAEMYGGTGKSSLNDVAVGYTQNVLCGATSYLTNTKYEIPLFKLDPPTSAPTTKYGYLTNSSSFYLAAENSPGLGDVILHTPSIESSGSVQATSFNATSDRRKKENINQAYFDATDYVNHLRVVNFNYIGNEEKTIGLIAQEVDELDCGVPLTATGSDGFEVLKETKLIYVLIKALQEANDRIDELEKQIKKEG